MTPSQFKRLKIKKSGQPIYNRVRKFKQSDVTPKCSVPVKAWNVISHNFACIAAWEFQKESLKPPEIK